MLSGQTWVDAKLANALKTSHARMFHTVKDTNGAWRPYAWRVLSEALKEDAEEMGEGTPSVIATYAADLTLIVALLLDTSRDDVLQNVLDASIEHTFLFLGMYRDVKKRDGTYSKEEIIIIEQSLALIRTLQEDPEYQRPT